MLKPGDEAVLRRVADVAPTHRRRGLARALLDALFARARELGCREAWVGTEPGNHAARALYSSAGARQLPTSS
jgi:ribosomal protein S18 acetylase RimI-like enzyme